MSQSTDAILFYGYCWTDESPPWVDPNDYESEDEDAGDDEERYLRLAGFDEKYDGDASYFDRKRDVMSKATGEIIRHCSDGCTMYGVAVAGSSTTAWRGSPRTIDASALAPKPEWAEMLRVYCDHMKINVADKEPSWHLVSWWG